MSSSEIEQRIEQRRALENARKVKHVLIQLKIKSIKSILFDSDDNFTNLRNNKRS